jgi:hypothetical protein
MSHTILILIILCFLTWKRRFVIEFQKIIASKQTFEKKFRQRSDLNEFLLIVVEFIQGINRLLSPISDLNHQILPTKGYKFTRN